MRRRDHAVFLIQRGYVLRLDDDGVLTRGGKRLAWPDLKEVKTVYGEVGKRTLNNARLVFSRGSAVFFPKTIENADAVLELIRRKTGQPLPMNKPA